MKIAALLLCATMAVSAYAALPIAPKFCAVDSTRPIDISHGLKCQEYHDNWEWISDDSQAIPMKVTVVANADGSLTASEAYEIAALPTGIEVLARSERAARYALSDIDKMLSDSDGGTMPSIHIIDYPTLPIRGIVEGFYGIPWTHEMRLSMIDLCKEHKLNTYIYAPKDDPYHRHPLWREPYPQDKADMIGELARRAADNNVQFVWAISPGIDIKWTEEDYKSMLDKFEQMYVQGVRQFAVFFDDIHGEGSRSDKQVELVNKLTRDFVKAKGDVADIIICPTDYTKQWANPSADGQLAVYGRGLAPEIEVLYTGDRIFSDLTPQVMEFADTLLNRPALFWWNFPVNDYCTNQLLLGPSYGLGSDVTAEATSGILTNPMEMGEASKPAIISVAKYAWNPAEYSPMDAWKESIAIVAGDAAQPYMAFAEHSADSRIRGYRRAESWTMPAFDMNRYTPADCQELVVYFTSLSLVPQKVRETIQNDNLLQEVDPWLTTMQTTCTRAALAAKLLQDWALLSPDELQQRIGQIALDPEQQQAFDAHKWGTQRIVPFINDVLARFGADQ